jgi:hypothetical protein
MSSNNDAPPLSAYDSPAARIWNIPLIRKWILEAIPTDCLLECLTLDKDSFPDAVRVLYELPIRLVDYEKMIASSSDSVSAALLRGIYGC